jgi:hypothetical protein
MQLSANHHIAATVRRRVLTVILHCLCQDGRSFTGGLAAEHNLSRRDLSSGRRKQKVIAPSASFDTRRSSKTRVFAKGPYEHGRI